MIFRMLFTCVVILLFNAGLMAQNDSLPEKPPCVVPDFSCLKTCVGDGVDLIISPIRWKKDQWAVFTGITGAAIAGFAFDASIRDIARKNRSSFADNICKYGLEPWGSGVYTIPALGILYGAGAIVHDDRARYTALKGFEAYCFAAVSAQIIKQLTHRQRPYQGNPGDPNRWDGPFHKPSGSSFVSGHSTVVFAVATVVATSYRKTVWVPVACYSLATLTALSRVYQDRHWFSDVLAGSALGFAIGKTIINNQNKRIEVIPVSHIGPGIMFVYHLD